MKKKVLLTILLVILAFTVLSAINTPRFSEAKANRRVNIGWTEVNVREGYSTSDNIITKLVKGDTVTLTGRTFEYWGGNDSQATEHWAEVQLSDGTVGWIVYRSIDW